MLLDLKITLKMFRISQSDLEAGFKSWFTQLGEILVFRGIDKSMVEVDVTDFCTAI